MNNETFHIALFLANNQPVYKRAWALAESVSRQEETTSADPNCHPPARIILADMLQGLVEDAYLRVDDREMDCKTDTDYLAHSLLTAALGRVNWLELSEEWLGTDQEKSEAAVHA